MSEIVEQEERRLTSDARSIISSKRTSSNYATKRRRKQEIEYSCGCKYLFNHETVLEHICSEHERELITLHG
jgi:vacuolar-type H+-ATPase subunit E/Vma4